MAVQKSENKKAEGLQGAGEVQSDMEIYAAHLASLAQSGLKPDMLILREKNLPEAEYEKLLKMVRKRLEKSSIELIPHTWLKAAKNTGISKIHLPFSLLKKYMESEASCENKRILQEMEVIGASVHSVEEAIEAEKMGVTYVTAGHIFSTECKPGLEPRGLEFLQSVCEAVELPVYAIGGIHPKRLEEVAGAGAAGACMMSEYMRLHFNTAV